MNAVLLYCALAPALVGGDPSAPAPSKPATKSIAPVSAEVVITDIPRDSSTVAAALAQSASEPLAPVVSIDDRPASPSKSFAQEQEKVAASNNNLPVPMKVPSKKLRGSVVFVCPPTLRDAADTWIEYRESQGYKVLVVDGQNSAAVIRSTIRQLVRQHANVGRPVKAIVLVGDTEPNLRRDAKVRRRTTPTFVATAEINEKLTGDSQVPSDNPYCDLDSDNLPDLPLGRLSVDTPEQLRNLTERIIRYERLPRSGEWRRTVHLTAGVGDFGLLADSVIETAAKKFLTDGLPAEYRTTMTYGSWRSPFCPDPRTFRETMLRRVDEGCLFWVYMGHGQPYRLDRLEISDQLFPILEASDVRRFRSSHGMPIAILLACFAGAYDIQQDCLAENLLRNPDGPIAVMAASRVTLPYSMTLMGTSLMDAYFDPSAGSSSVTLGELYLKGKLGLASEKAGGKNRRLIETMARTLSPTRENLPQERREHLFLFNLFGDPLLEIQRPQRIPIACETQVRPGQNMRAEVQIPFDGRCEVELVCRRDRFTFEPARRKSLASNPDQLATMNATYSKANDPRWLHQSVNVRKGRFYVDLPVPDEARGPCHLRMMLYNDQRIAVGSTDVYVQQGSTSTAGRARRTSTSR